MTKTTLLVSNVIIACLLAVGLHGCTDAEQQAAKTAAETSSPNSSALTDTALPQPDVTKSPEPEATPETPTEPEKVTEYMLDDHVVCTCLTQSECGITVTHCGDGKIRACMHNVTYSEIEMTKNDTNNVNCS
jgi:hypothetical protein